MLIPQGARTPWSPRLCRGGIKLARISVHSIPPVGNKMHKAFPLPVMEFPLPEEVPTARRKEMPLLLRFALLLKSRKFGDSYEVPRDVATTGSASDGTSKKKGRTVTLTTDDIQKRKNDVKARTTLLLSLPDEHQLRFTKHNSGNEEVNIASVSAASTNVSTASPNIGVASISRDTACAYIASQSIGSQIKFEDISQIDEDDIEEMDIKLNMALLSMRAYRTGSKGIDGNWWSGMGLELYANDDENHALVADEEAPLEFTLMAKTNAESERLGYSVVPPPPAQVYSPPKKDMSWTGLSEFADDTVTDYSRPAPTIESSPDDAQNRNLFVTETGASPSTISPKPFIKFVKATIRSTETKTAKVETAKHVVKYAAMYSKSLKSSNVRGNQRNWNNLKSHQLGPKFMMKKKACFNCGDFNHLAYDCSKRRKHSAIHKPYKPPMRPIRPNMNVAQPKRTSFHKLAHSYNKRPVQRTSAVRSQYRAPWVPTVNRNFPSVNRKFSTVSRKFSTINRKFPSANRKFPTSSPKFFTADMGKKGNAVKASVCWIWKPRQNATNKGPNSNSVSVMFKKAVPRITLMTNAIRTVATLAVTMGENLEIRRWMIFCSQKGIKREFSNARTPQQNGVAERRNRTLIEAARTMLADAKLPVTFWAEAVNTACYVQNRVLVNKSHNKTPYELFNGRSPAIGFLKPFRCHVMILNTLGHLGKFEAKGDESYFIGYFISSKAFRVFNKKTKRVEENLHVEFLENKAIEKGVGPN
nr:retrovirus-related Pol polyprotein from transposon TNT 1-94 [Tanacetum cinerariifolium]GEY94925.1 retrovirus-related Pol polyprotein from transposon TNT 1-94 [Tanacetum cinerariifolium]